MTGIKKGKKPKDPGTWVARQRIGQKALEVRAHWFQVLGGAESACGELHLAGIPAIELTRGRSRGYFADLGIRCCNTCRDLHDAVFYPLTEEKP